MKTLKSLIIAVAAVVLIVAIPHTALAAENSDNVSLDDVASLIKEMAVKTDGATTNTANTIKKNAVTFCMVGEEYKKNGQNEEALVYFELALKLDPEYKRAQKGIDDINHQVLALN